MMAQRQHSTMHHAEREMSAHQLGLIDDCFEEGQYEVGISVLDSLRSPETKPSASHIRQLLYLALYPPQTTTKGSTGDGADLPPSLGNAKQQSSTVVPAEAASSVAVSLLDAFASTNSPGAMLRSLPNCNSHDVSGALKSSLNAQEDEDSFLARQSRCIRGAKNCWEILKEGFVKPQGGASPPRTGKATRKSRSSPLPTEADDEHEFAQPAAVGTTAWPVLGWLLTVLEKEQAVSEYTESSRYSSFLLSQIPLPRSTTQKRWDVASTLEVVTFCLEQGDSLKRAMGNRLLVLLVNLTATDHVDLPAFLVSMFSHLQLLPVPTTPFLLSALPRTLVATQFKLAFCKHLLAGNSPTQSTPKPQVRARPVRSKRNTVAEKDPQDQIGTRSGSFGRYPAITSNDILDVLEKSAPGDPQSIQAMLRIKHELVLAFFTMQSLAEDSGRDAEWSRIANNGTLASTVGRIFAPSTWGESSDEAREVATMKQILLNMIRAYCDS